MKTGSMWLNIAVITIWKKKNMISGWRIVRRSSSEITGMPASRIVLRTRQRKSNRQDQYQKLDDEQQFMEVSEQGLKFKINLTDYLDTGLFLDHRITRAMVRDRSAGKRVLNLFCYTGSFSVYAAPEEQQKWFPWISPKPT